MDFQFTRERSAASEERVSLSFCAVKPRLFRAGIGGAGCNATKKSIVFEN